MKDPLGPASKRVNAIDSLDEAPNLLRPKLGQYTSPLVRSRKGRGWRTVPVLALATLAVGVAVWFVIRQRDTSEPDALDSAADITLVDTSGKPVSLAPSDGDAAVVLFFLGLECPVSNHYAPEMRRLAEHYRPRGVRFRGVHSGPGVSAEAAERHKEEHALPFPVLLDPELELAEGVRVDETPEAVVLDREGIVVYRGRIDDRYSEEGRRRKAARTHDLQAALDDLLAGRMPTVPVTEPFGCPLPKPRASETSGPITYSEHVAPILARRCVSCHRPGEVGPFSLQTYRDVARRADFIRDVTASRRMPPWKPRHDFGQFLDGPRLSRRELAVLSEWADAGAPEGNPCADTVPNAPSAPQWQLGTPDLVLQMKDAFSIPAAEDVYRAFVLPIPVGQETGISAIEFRPGNRKVVHHARLYLDQHQRGRVRDDADPLPGFGTLGGNDIPMPTIAAWTPGVSPREFPPGVGHLVRRGVDLVLLMHYHSLGTAQTDQSSVGLYFAKTPITRAMRSVPLSTEKIDIPAGEPRHRIRLRAILPTDVHAYSVLPHGHYLMREIKLWATLPDGSVRRLLWIDDWDINWQGTYHFAEPVGLPKGTKLHVIATYDNSDGNHANPNHPPKRVGFGPASTDEMLGCHVQILPDRPENDHHLTRKWPLAL